MKYYSLYHWIVRKRGRPQPILGSSSLPLGHTTSPVHTLATSLTVLIPQLARPDCTPPPSLLCFLPVKRRYNVDGVHTETVPTRCMKKQHGAYLSAPLCYEQKLYPKWLHSLNFSSENYYEALVSPSRTSRICRLWILFKVTKWL